VKKKMSGGIIFVHRDLARLRKVYVRKINQII
jgi:hypothetical protein